MDMYNGPFQDCPVGDEWVLKGVKQGSRSRTRRWTTDNNANSSCCYIHILPQVYCLISNHFILFSKCSLLKLSAILKEQ